LRPARGRFVEGQYGVAQVLTAQSAANVNSAGSLALAPLVFKPRDSLVDNGL
jgi:hypothetical protein